MYIYYIYIYHISDDIDDKNNRATQRHTESSSPTSWTSLSNSTPMPRSKVYRDYQRWQGLHTVSSKAADLCRLQTRWGRGFHFHRNQAVETCAGNPCRDHMCSPICPSRNRHRSNVLPWTPPLSGDLDMVKTPMWDDLGWSVKIQVSNGFQVRSGRAQSRTSLKGISPCLSEFQVAGFSLRWNKMRQQALRVPTRQWLCPWPRTFTQRHSNHTATLRPLFCSTCQNDGLNCLQGKLHLL